MLKKIYNNRLYTYIESIMIIVGAISFFTLIAFVNPITHHYLPGCIYYELTGIQCAGCGLTRAAHYMLSGDFLLALQYNFTVFYIVPGIFYMIFRYVRWRLYKKPPVFAMSPIPFYIIALVFIVFSVVRFILYFI